MKERPQIPTTAFAAAGVRHQPPRCSAVRNHPSDAHVTHDVSWEPDLL